MILRLSETPKGRDACGSGLHGIRADPSPAQELPRAFECPKPFLERRQDGDDDVLLCPERRRRIWRLLAKPKQARNFKDLKHLKCRYTFRIRAFISLVGPLCPMLDRWRFQVSLRLSHRFKNWRQMNWNCLHEVEIVCWV